jgi:transcriptional regulator with XRE-family HTH domain
MNAGERLAAARERAGLTAEATAERAGLPLAWYEELESSATDLYSNVSLAGLRAVAHAVGATPCELLLAPAAARPRARAPFTELAAAVRQAVSRSGLSIEMWSETVGWEVGPILLDPDHLWTLPADALKDVCAGAGRDWLEFLPD